MSVILMTTLYNIALVLQAEIWCWSLLGIKGLIRLLFVLQIRTEVQFCLAKRRFATSFWKTSLEFTLGNSCPGCGTHKNLHRGSQPSLTLKINKFSSLTFLYTSSFHSKYLSRCLCLFILALSRSACRRSSLWFSLLLLALTSFYLPTFFAKILSSSSTSNALSLAIVFTCSTRVDSWSLPLTFSLLSTLNLSSTR